MARHVRRPIRRDACPHDDKPWWELEDRPPPWDAHFDDEAERLRRLRAQGFANRLRRLRAQGFANRLRRLRAQGFANRLRRRDRKRSSGSVPPPPSRRDRPSAS